MWGVKGGTGKPLKESKSGKTNERQSTRTVEENESLVRV